MGIYHASPRASDKPIKLEGLCFNYFKATRHTCSLSVMETAFDVTS